MSAEPVNWSNEVVQNKINQLNKSSVDDNHPPAETPLASIPRDKHNIPAEMYDDILVPGRLRLPGTIDSELTPDFYFTRANPKKKSKLGNQPPSIEHLNRNGELSDIHFDWHAKQVLRKTVKQVLGVISDGVKSTILHVELRKPLSSLDHPADNKCVAKIFKTSFWNSSNDNSYKSKVAEALRHRKTIEYAEKEFLYLRRMKTAGIQVPIAIAHKSCIIFMSFLGNDEGEALSRLQNLRLNAHQECQVYFQTLSMLRVLYNTPDLVIPDVSESNILVDYYTSNCWLVDVATGVECDRWEAMVAACIRLEVVSVDNIIFVFFFFKTQPTIFLIRSL